MRSSFRWLGVLALAVAMVSGCGGARAKEGPNDPSAPVSASAVEPAAWGDLEVDCPALTAVGFESAQPVANPMRRMIDNEALLGVMCSYKLDPAAPSVVLTRLQIDRDPAKSGLSAETVASDRADKVGKGQVVIELPGLGRLATASAEGSAFVEAVTFSKNARLFALVQFDKPIKTEAEIREHSDVLTAVLRDMIGNLRPGSRASEQAVDK